MQHSMGPTAAALVWLVQTDCRDMHANDSWMWCWLDLAREVRALPGGAELSEQDVRDIASVGLAALTRREQWLRQFGGEALPPPVAAQVRAAWQRAVEAMRWEVERRGDRTGQLMTQVEAARLLGLSRQRVHELVHALGLGVEVAGGGRLLTAADIEAIRNRPRGRRGPKPRQQASD